MAAASCLRLSLLNSRLLSALAARKRLLPEPWASPATAALLTSISTLRAGEKVTHTGQVNESFAIHLVAEEPVTEVTDRVVSCDGGGGALGHPKVYINLDKDTKVGTCGYCGLRFKQTHHH
uniref:NADH dehydrogenase [ubiquinone] iron-sulfur protein 6, mitochondrial isoform X2 n=1 Tax=Pristiophorus japonicus TaxID=55135 RepID=UPI00398E7115